MADKLTLISAFESHFSCSSNEESVFAGHSNQEPSGCIWMTCKVLFIFSIVLLALFVPLLILTGFFVMRLAFEPGLIDAYGINIDRDLLNRIAFLYTFLFYFLAKLTFNQAFAGCKVVSKINLKYMFIFQFYTAVNFTIAFISVFIANSKIIPAFFIGFELLLFTLSMVTAKLIKEANPDYSN